MDANQANSRLADITTLWTVVCRAHGDPAAAAGVDEAKRELLERYGKAVYRYLAGAVRDADVAGDLAQEFAVRLLQGRLRRADPERGRFRDFVKGVLFHLIADFHRRRKSRPKPLASAALDAAAPEPAAAQDRAFDESWRDELLSRTWNALASVPGQAGATFVAVLRFRTQHPACHSPEMAEKLSAQLGKPVTAAWVRQTLHRARDRFADLLIQEVVQTLASPTETELEQELIDLGLLAYCEEAMKRRRQ
jgi:RNA polymerase sigma-70 factor (ECF subfamily)